MSSAYAFAEDGEQRIPDEIILVRSVDKYGVQAVFGRPLSFHEIRMMSLADNVVNAHRERAKSGNWAEWAEANPNKARILADAGKLYGEEE